MHSKVCFWRRRGWVGFISILFVPNVFLNLKHFPIFQCIPQDVANISTLLFHLFCLNLSFFHIYRKGKGETLSSNRNFYFGEPPKFLFSIMDESK